MTVEIEDNAIVIRITADELAFAAKYHPGLTVWDSHNQDAVGPTITDKQQWMRSVLSALRNEEEDGTTAVHQMLDIAMVDAVEMGCEGIRMFGDDD